MATTMGVNSTAWHKCMAKAYCKWPLIFACISAGLIVLSILLSLVGCLCCGMRFCCGCCRCCGGRSSSSRRKRASPANAAEPWYSAPPVYNGYHAAAPQSPVYPPPPQVGHSPGYQPQPQFAQYDFSRREEGKGAATAIHNEDALPPMPSWADAQQRRVLVEPSPAGHHQDIELGQIDTSAGQQHADKLPTKASPATSYAVHELSSETSSQAGGYQRMQQGQLSTHNTGVSSLSSPVQQPRQRMQQEPLYTHNTGVSSLSSPVQQPQRFHYPYATQPSPVQSPYAYAHHNNHPEHVVSPISSYPTYSAQNMR